MLSPKQSDKNKTVLFVVEELWDGSSFEGLTLHILAESSILKIKLFTNSLTLSSIHGGWVGGGGTDMIT